MGLAASAPIIDDEKEDSAPIIDDEKEEVISLAKLKVKVERLEAVTDLRIRELLVQMKELGIKVKELELSKESGRTK